MEAKSTNQARSAEVARPASPVAESRRVDSATLLGPVGQIEILHHGNTYRLRSTRQGKLILTK